MKKIGKKIRGKTLGKFCMPKAKKVGFVFSCWTGEKVNLPEQHLKAQQILSSLKINCRSQKNNLCRSVRKKVRKKIGKKIGKKIRKKIGKKIRQKNWEEN